VYELPRQLAAVADARPKPQIQTGTALGAVMAMCLARLGSLNALAESRGHGFWGHWLEGAGLPSDRSIGRVMAGLDCRAVRQSLRCFYHRRQRNKSLPGFYLGERALILDGHESSASFRRSCPACLRRKLKTKAGERTQYYHRLVAATLLCGQSRLLLDCELQRPEEDEVACATRLLERVLADYPRAFGLILADGLYARADFFQLALRHGKHVIAVLKDERRDLLQDALGIFRSQPPSLSFKRDRTECQCWDLENFTSWPQLGCAARVVRSLEQTAVSRQSDGAAEVRQSEWVWATTLPQTQLPTEGVVRFGHGRWTIENEGGFNELVNQWHADHVYRHQANAILAFWLMTKLAFNLFHAFIELNLKPALRAAHSPNYWAKLITAEFYQSAPENRAPP